MRILIVEDEKRLAETLADIMSEEKYASDISPDGETGFDNAMSGIYDAVILDVMLPGMNGFEIVRKMRLAGNKTPVLMLTAKGETADKVTGLDSGADYYLTKPFEIDELLACLRAITRKQNEAALSQLAYEDLALDLSTCVLRCGVRSVQLGYKEFEIMRMLLINKKAIIPKETFMLKIWGFDSSVSDNNVEVYISFLRKKLAYIKSRVTITIVRKIGYHLEVSGLC